MHHRSIHSRRHFLGQAGGGVIAGDLDEALLAPEQVADPRRERRAHADRALDRAFADLTAGAEPGPAELPVQGRVLRLRLASGTLDRPALEEVNDSKFGLQAGLFTSDLHKVLEAWDHLDVGGIVVNDVSSYRVDNMPYGGVKDSGLGREGVKFAMEDMTEIRNLVIRQRPVEGPPAGPSR